MHEMRTIAENISTIRARRLQLAGIRPSDPVEADELTRLECQHSRFEDMCLRHHRLNLCQAGFVYGGILRHPADPAAGVVVRLGDRVEIVEGPDARDGEISIVEATTAMARRLGRGLAFRDWIADGESLGSREDALFLARIGSPAPPRAATSAVSVPEPEGGSSQAPSDRAASEVRSSQPRPRRPRQDDLTPDLFG